MRGLFLIPVVAAVQFIEMHDELMPHMDYAGLKESLLSIHKATAGSELDQLTLQAVQNILDTINNTLITALESDRNHSQHLLDSARQAVIDCDNDREMYFGNNKTWHWDNVDVTTALQDHNNCRDEEDDEYDNMTYHCDLVNSTVCNWPKCGQKPSFSGGDNDEIEEWVCCIQDFFADYSPLYETQRQNCIDATSVHALKRTECHGKQEDLELEVCSREQGVQTNCELYRTCRDREESDWVTVTNNTRDLEEIFQAQRVALECLLCYGNKILNNQTDLTSCDANMICTDLVNCPVIDYQPIPDFVRCEEPDDFVPCTAGYEAQYYDEYIGTNTTVQACTTCNPEVTNTEGPLNS